jgi:hypothetical protein
MVSDTFTKWGDVSLELLVEAARCVRTGERRMVMPVQFGTPCRGLPRPDITDYKSNHV